MHIEKKVLDAFQKNELESAEYIQVLEHIKSCDYCAENLASLEEESTIQAPQYLKDQIVNRARMLDVQATVQRNKMFRLKKTSKNVQLLLHSIKTATAVAGALLILFAVTRMENVGMFEKTYITEEFSGRLSEGSNNVVDFMNEFSNQIINGGMKK